MKKSTNIFLIIIIFLSLMLTIIFLYQTINISKLYLEAITNESSYAILVTTKKMMGLYAFTFLASLIIFCFNIGFFIKIQRLKNAQAIEISQEQQSKKFRKKQEIKEQKITQKIKELEKELNDLQK